MLASDQRRGAEVFATDLGEVLAARGHQVRNVALAHEADGDGIDVPSVGTRRLGLSTLLRLRQASASAGLIVAHGSSTLAACAMAMPCLPAPFVYRNIGDPGYWAASSMRRLRTVAFLSQASAVAVLWPGAARTLAAVHHVPEAKLRVIPNGAPASRFPPIDAERRAAARRHLDIDEGVRVVLFVGALTPEKRVDRAIRALPSVPDAILLVLGGGPLRASLESLGAEVAPGRVRFAKPVSDPSLIMAVADTVVLPSETEGMPGVLIEAGLSALPAVATDVGGVAEVIVDGETGRLVDANQAGALAAALRDVLADPLRLGAAARARCLERFEINVVASKWNSLLAEFGVVP